jgi:hypothetical protein
MITLTTLTLARISHRVAYPGRRECRRFAARVPKDAAGVLNSMSKRPKSGAGEKCRPGEQGA